MRLPREASDPGFLSQAPQRPSPFPRPAQHPYPGLGCVGQPSPDFGSGVTKPNAGGHLDIRTRSEMSSLFGILADPRITGRPSSRSGQAAARGKQSWSAAQLRLEFGTAPEARPAKAPRSGLMGVGPAARSSSLASPSRVASPEQGHKLSSRGAAHRVALGAQSGSGELTLFL